MFELSEEMSESLLQRVPSETRRIHIGVSDEVDRPVVTEVVSHFLRSLAPEQRPKLTIIAGSHGQLVERLRFREIDVLISELAVMGPDLANLNRVDSAVALVCSRDWQFKASQRSRGTPSTIARISETEVIQWVMPSAKFKLRAEIDRFFEAHQIKGRVVFESDVMASLVRSVIDGIGMAFLPFLYVGREVREKSVRILSPKGGLWKYRVWLVCCRNNQDDPLIRAFSKSFSFVSESSRRQMV
jgi:DNA-binding transcriptional LysR family regulator